MKLMKLMEFIKLMKFMGITDYMETLRENSERLFETLQDYRKNQGLPPVSHACVKFRK